MVSDRKVIAKRLKQARGSRSMAAVGREAGISHASISRYEAAVIEPTAGALGRLARALDVSLDYLVGLNDDVKTSGQPPALADTTLEASVVPLRDVRAAGGWGAEVYEEPVVGHLAFPSRWLRQRGIRPNHCSVIEVVGDSMEPTLEDGAWILVDHQWRELVHRHIFVVQTENGLVVKRADRGGAGWQLSSDNLDYEPIACSREIVVVGRVVWTGKTV